MYPFEYREKSYRVLSIDSTSIIRIRTRVAIFSRGAKTFFPPFFLSNQLCISNNDYIWLNLWNNYCNNFPSFISIRYLRPGEYFSQRGWLRLIKRDFHSRTSFSINLFLVWRRYKAENSFSIGKRKKRISIEREEKLRDRTRKREERWDGFRDGFSHDGFYWLAGYFGADAKGGIDNGHGCVRYGRLTSYPVHSSRDREKKRLARSFACTVNGEFVSGTAGVAPTPFTLCNSYFKRIVDTHRTSIAFYPFSSQAFFFSFFLFVHFHAIFMICSILVLRFLEIFAHFAEQKVNRWHYLFLNVAYEYWIFRFFIL